MRPKPIIAWTWLLVASLGLAMAGDQVLAGQDAPPPAEEKKADESPPPKPEPKPKPSKKARKDQADEPQVLSKAEAEARKRSPFLRPPGASDDDYDMGDPLERPPWDGASFFGIEARGRFFVYVIDQSGSMIDDDRLTRATIELRRSVFALQSPQRFEVIVYNDESTTMPGGPIPRPADQRNKQLLRSWLRLIDPDGGTSPRSAILQALALRPSAVFLLSDGDFPDGVVEDIAKANSRNLPIHCVDMAAGLAGDSLKRIASQSGGRYVSRPGSLGGGP